MLFRSSAWFPDVQSAGVVIIVFTLVLYPYVYLLARTAFQSQGRNLIDAARTLGLSSRAAFLLPSSGATAHAQPPGPGFPEQAPSV